MSRGSRSSRSTRLWLAALLFLWASWFSAPVRAAERGPQAQQTPAALYHNYCSVCHGDKGDGQSRAQGSLKPPPRDFTTPQAMQDLTRDRMIAAVKGGVPGTAMVGWRSQLTDAQIASVVDYVRDTFMRPSVAADASRGRQIYARVCSVCHGDQGTGSMWASANLRPPPRDFSSQAAKDELTRDRMLAAVSQGRPKTAMQGYSARLSKEDMEGVVDYIRSAIMRVDADAGISGTHAHGAPGGGRISAVPVKLDAAADSHAAHGHGSHDHGSHEKGGKIDMKRPMPNGLRGDPAAGGKFYEANCATCHGVKGDGQGPRAYFINPKPAVFTDPKTRASMNRPVIYDGVAIGRRGSEMPAWGKVLSPQEIADVSEYVFRSFIQPGAGHVAKRR